MMNNAQQETLSRLSDLNIADPVLRGEFYRRIIDYVNDPTTEKTAITVLQVEQYRPDLMAYRLYNTAELRWLVCLICGVTDEADPLPVASRFYFPPSVWVRKTMRDYLDEIAE